jgi:NAD(P)-dependent dehydrogenase (short-subunit alcohol dehydrogenase family)
MQYRGVHSIVTGGSSGIGRALVARLVDRGSHVSILALDDHDLERVAADYADSAGAVTTYAVDVGDESKSRRPLPTPSRCTGRVTCSSRLRGSSGRVTSSNPRG